MAAQGRRPLASESPRQAVVLVGARPARPPVPAVAVVGQEEPEPPIGRPEQVVAGTVETVAVGVVRPTGVAVAEMGRRLVAAEEVPAVRAAGLGGHKVVVAVETRRPTVDAARHVVAVGPHPAALLVLVVTFVGVGKVTPPVRQQGRKVVTREVRPVRVARVVTAPSCPLLIRARPTRRQVLGPAPGRRPVLAAPILQGGTAGVAVGEVRGRRVLPTPAPLAVVTRPLGVTGLPPPLEVDGVVLLTGPRPAAALGAALARRLKTVAQARVAADAALVSPFPAPRDALSPEEVAVTVLARLRRPKARPRLRLGVVATETLATVARPGSPPRRPSPVAVRPPLRGAAGVVRGLPAVDEVTMAAPQGPTRLVTPRVEAGDEVAPPGRPPVVAPATDAKGVGVLGLRGVGVVPYEGVHAPHDVPHGMGRPAIPFPSHSPGYVDVPFVDDVVC